MTVLLSGSVAFAAAFAYSSFFEWALHKFVMHSARLLRYPHRAHELEHHALFRADATYFLPGGLHPESDAHHLTFAWWNAPLLIALHLPLFALVYLLGGLGAVGGALLAMTAYYALYEYLHYAMHVPRGRWFERTRLFAFIQAHHRVHHLSYQRNLNVVLPLADLVLGTRLRPWPGLFEKLERRRLERQGRLGAGGGEALGLEPLRGAAPGRAECVMRTELKE
jgi:hypothetical protein